MVVRVIDRQALGVGCGEQISVGADKDWVSEAIQPHCFNCCKRRRELHSIISTKAVLLCEQHCAIYQSGEHRYPRILMNFMHDQQRKEPITLLL